MLPAPVGQAAHGPENVAGNLVLVGCGQGQRSQRAEKGADRHAAHDQGQGVCSAAAEHGDAHDHADRQHGAEKGIERQDEECGRAAGDRQQGAQAGAGGNAEDARFSQRIAENALHDRSGYSQAAAGQNGRGDARQPDQQDDGPVGRVKVADRQAQGGRQAAQDRPGADG